ncbi:MAG: putative nodulation efficiency protein [Pseudomonadota bacterium]|jgi:membrane protein implicated in regulation of membrane protease activity
MDSIKIAFWHWWVVGVLLTLVEMFVPGAALIWLGLAAGATGLALLLMPDLAWQWQFGFFALLSIAFVVAARLLPQRPPAQTDEPALNRRADQYTGQVVVLESAIAAGRGRAFIGDSLWTVAGPDLPIGARVKVTGSDGAVLRVEPAER